MLQELLIRTLHGTQSDNPYRLTGNLIIAHNATLTILPGTLVQLGHFSIQVSGTLIARGTPANQIAFYGTSPARLGLDDARIVFMPDSASWNESSQSGSIIQYTNVTDSQQGAFNIYLDSASPKIDCDFLSPTYK